MAILKRIWVPLVAIVTLSLAGSCQTEGKKAEQNSASTEDPLPSWNEGDTKTRILDFVTSATDEQSEGYIPVNERISTFDNDGTLWSEQPLYFQLFFAYDRLVFLAEENPELWSIEPYRSILSNGLMAFSELELKEVLALIQRTHAGTSTDEFAEIASTWIDTARHPVIDTPYTKLVYQPMLELLQYLRANSFKTYIVSGGGVEFMRPWTERIYGIPPEQVIGSSIKTKWVNEEDQAPYIDRLPELNFIDDKEGKPIAINQFIGRRPAICAGNSDGDLQMMLYTETGDHPFLNLIVHHTDSVREWAYDRESDIGKLNVALDLAAEKNWTIINMANDWNQVYPD